MKGKEVGVYVGVGNGDPTEARFRMVLEAARGDRVKYRD